MEVGQRVGHVLGEFADRHEAARSLGCGPAQIESYIAGSKAPPFEVLTRLSALTGVSLDWLAFGAGPIMRAAAGQDSPDPHGTDPDPPKTPPGVDPETLTLVIRAVLEALDEERLTLYTDATSELIALVYDAVCEADGEAPPAGGNQIEIAKDKLRRVLPLILSGRTS